MSDSPPPPPQYESLFSNDISGQSSVSITPLLQKWTETITVNDFDMDSVPPGAFPPLFAWSTINEIPDIGDPHPYHVNAYVMDIQVEPVTVDSTTHLRAFVTYVCPGNFSSLQIDTYTQQEIRNYDIEGKLTQVFYKLVGGLGGVGVVFSPYTTDVRVPKVIHAIRVTQYETEDDNDGDNSTIAGLVGVVGDSPASRYAFWNADEFWGFKPAQLLSVGTRTTSEGVPIYRREYTFLVDLFNGWSHSFAIFVGENGLVPQGVVPFQPGDVDVTAGTITNDPNHNGAAAYAMLDSEQFDAFFSNLKPPVGNFQTTTN